MYEICFYLRGNGGMASYLTATRDLQLKIFLIEKKFTTMKNSIGSREAV
jgi:hypothetical protein